MPKGLREGGWRLNPHFHALVLKRGLEGGEEREAMWCWKSDSGRGSSRELAWRSPRGECNLLSTLKIQICLIVSM